MRAYLQVITKYTCELCGAKHIHHVAPAPRICKACCINESIKNNLINEEG